MTQAIGKRDKWGKDTLTISLSWHLQQNYSEKLQAYMYMKLLFPESESPVLNCKNVLETKAFT